MNHLPEHIRDIAAEIQAEELARSERQEQKRPSFGPSRDGSPRCESGSVASGGTKTYCSCDICF